MRTPPEVARLSRQEHDGGTTDPDGVEPERLGFFSYGGSGSRVSPVAVMKPSMRPGRYWIGLSRLLTVAASWSTPRAVRLPNAALTLAHTPSAQFSSGAYGGSRYTVNQSCESMNWRIAWPVCARSLSHTHTIGAPPSWWCAARSSCA